jgi:hypothetical protein
VIAGTSRPHRSNSRVQPCLLAFRIFLLFREPCNLIYVWYRKRACGRSANVARSAARRDRAESGARRRCGEKRAEAPVRRGRHGRVMSTDAAASAVSFVTALGGASTAWPDELWAGSVSWMDAILRSYYGIYEFTDDPACVLRVGLGQARTSVSLSDGTRVEVGELIGTLHFWNEHLPRYSSKGPDLGWACAVRDRVICSLRAFSEYIENEPAWHEVRAIRTETALPARLGASQIGRVFQRYGFERVPTDFSVRARLHGLGECFVLWGLTRAFNPAALPRQPFLRDRHQLWISRATLRTLYARRSGQRATRTAQRRGT